MCGIGGVWGAGGGPVLLPLGRRLPLASLGSSASLPPASPASLPTRA